MSGLAYASALASADDAGSRSQVRLLVGNLVGRLVGRLVGPRHHLTLAAQLQLQANASALDWLKVADTPPRFK